MDGQARHPAAAHQSRHHLLLVRVPEVLSGIEPGAGTRNADHRHPVVRSCRSGGFNYFAGAVGMCDRGGADLRCVPADGPILALRSDARHGDPGFSVPL